MRICCMTNSSYIVTVAYRYIVICKVAMEILEREAHQADQVDLVLKVVSDAEVVKVDRDELVTQDLQDHRLGHLFVC